MKKEIIEWLKAFLFAIIFVSIVNVFFTTTMVYSISMKSTLIEKDLLLLRRTQEFERGDIVSFKSDLTLSSSDIRKLNPLQRLFVSEKTHKNLIKRVIGLPGDSIDVANGQVFVNGELLTEPYVSSYTTGEVHITKIPDENYFLMGDNRSHSMDSRSDLVGTVEQERFIGKVLIRLFPLTRIGTVE